MLALTPITLREANAFVAAHHRHHQPARGCIMCVAAKAPKLLAISGGGTPAGPAEIAEETLVAIASEDADRALMLALRLATAVLRAADADFSPAIPRPYTISRK